MSVLDKVKLLIKGPKEKITVEPDGHRGCVFVMNLPVIKDGRARPAEVVMSPYPVPMWVSFN